MKFIGRVTILNVAGRAVKAIVPSGHHDQTEFDKLRIGNEYKVDARKARNPDHHRKGFALINLIFDSQEKYTTIEHMLTELKLQAGWYEEHVRSNGELVMIPKSISFADMDQTQFEEFYDRVTDIAIQQYGLEDALDFI